MFYVQVPYLVEGLESYQGCNVFQLEKLRKYWLKNTPRAGAEHDLVLQATCLLQAGPVISLSLM